jgi:ribosomal-protein-alanine N-acetyltransferase
MKLKTTRLLLSPVGADKLDVIYEILTNEFVKKYLCLSKDQVQSFIDTSDDLFSEKKYGLWCLHTEASNEMIELSGLWFFFEETQPQLLYALLPQHTKLGYAKEASLAIIKYAFNHLRFTHLDAS